MRRLFAIDAYKHMNVLMTNDLYSRITTKNFSKMDLGLWLYMSPWCLDKLTKDWNEAQKVLAWIRETSMRTVSLCKLVEYICLSLSNKWKTWPIIVPIGLGKHPRERRRYASSSVLIVLTLLWYGSSAALFQLIWFKIRKESLPLIFFFLLFLFQTPASFHFLLFSAQIPTRNIPFLRTE